LRDIRASGAGVNEISYYHPLANLLNELGKPLKPKVRCILNLRNRGAGIPDGGLFTAEQMKKTAPDEWHEGQIPNRGVLEVKGTGVELVALAGSEQVARYLQRYGLILITNLRDFAIVGRDARGVADVLEDFRLADSEASFWRAAVHPRTLAETHGVAFAEFLTRALLQAAPLTSPQDVAWFLASYARDARHRVEAADLPALASLRTALEDALGISFSGDKGEHFFRSTFVQTLFYGVFSAWVLWHREQPVRTDIFDWRTAVHHLRVPMLQALFHQVSSPANLRPLGLVPILDHTASVLNRVQRPAFFASFEEEHAVQYFYEPFLEAFDPALRKDLGVWYTPREIVQYMVARVDTVLRSELDIPDGLADPRVYVLDPCCGTGAYLVEVLRNIQETVTAKGGGDALQGADLRKAATERVFGFEILPAPYVVAHLQLGLMLHHAGAPLVEERAGIYLTNALTGWEPEKHPKKLLFPEMQAEHDAADKVKQQAPILVIIGNPPYNGYAGMAVDEERELSTAYRSVRRAAPPQGQGLNDLFVRFFRMAERRIIEKSGRGEVCFISNYSWLDGLSFTGMRERYLDVFDRVDVDCLNGDKYKTGKLTPEGKPDPSVFSTDQNREGIQVGTAITTLVRTGAARSEPGAAVRFRHFWGANKRNDLLAATDSNYAEIVPAVELGYTLLPTSQQPEYFTWPQLPELFPASFPGVKTSRDDFLVAIDRDRLEERIKAYFDPAVSDEEMRSIGPGVMEKTASFDPAATRATLQRRGPRLEGIVRYAYRPFDVRWLYWEPETDLLDRERSEYVPHVFEGNRWFSAGQRNRKDDFYQPQVTERLADHHIVESNVGMFPMLLNNPLLGEHTPNWTPGAEKYLMKIGATVSDVNVSHSRHPGGRRGPGTGKLDAGFHRHDGREQARSIPFSEELISNLFHHCIAVAHSPEYVSRNAGALRQDWPRIPLPAKKADLLDSAELGRRVAALLDTEHPVEGVCSGTIRPELQKIAVIARVGGGALHPGTDDLAVTAGWGHAGKGGVTMPGRGKTVDGDPTGIPAALGRPVFDVHLNDVAFWKSVPQRVWEYTIGGYQVIKKWLSYRERALLGRPLAIEEARYVTEMARRIAALVLLESELDANYRRVTAATYPWPRE